MKWAEATSPRIGSLSRDTPLLLNISAIEQHGPHLPVGTDAMIGAHFTDLADLTLADDVLVLPQIQVCCSAHHLDFAGTLSVGHATLQAYLSGIATTALAQGFRNLVILNSHGGNQAIGQVVATELGQAFPEAHIVMATWWTLAHRALLALNESGPGGVGHACEFETALMLLIAPHLVRSDLIADPVLPKTFTWAESDMLRGAQASLYRSMKTQSGGSGVVGRPSFATAEKGSKISEAVTSELVTVLRTLRRPESL